MEHFIKFTLPSHLLALSILVFAIQDGVLAYFVGAALACWVLMSIGVEVGIHRLFSHQAFTTPRWVEVMLMYLGTIAGQGPISFWVIIHKGYHHPKADTEDDPHSPIHGFWQSYIGWMLTKDPAGYSPRSSIHLLRDPAQRTFQYWYYPIIYGTVVCLYLVSPYLAGAYFMASALCLHQNLMVNWLCHKGTIGYKSYPNSSNARNLPWLSPITWGLSLHNNHHHDPGSYTLSRKWWELDPASWVIKLVATSRREPRSTETSAV